LQFKPFRHFLIVFGSKIKFANIIYFNFKDKYKLLIQARLKAAARLTGKQAWITLKSADSNVLSRSEYEYDILIADGKELFASFTENGAEKIRYRIPNGRFTWEVDEFLGDNRGLIVAEIELQTEQDAFEKPDWISAEVTKDERYANSSLAVKPFKDW
jgi:adenylate cyclase